MINNRKQNIYISGSITNNSNAWHDFEEAEKEILKAGDNPINPLKENAKLPGSTTYCKYMSMCMGMLAEADAIYLIPGWENSLGAHMEVFAAGRDGKKIIT